MRQAKQRGSTMIEFAIGSTVFVALFTGVFQFGWSFLLYNNLMASVTNAAVFAAKRDYDQASPSSFESDIKNLVVYGDTSAGTVPLAPGLTTSNVSVNVTASAGVPQYVTVSINNYQIQTVFKNYTLLNKPRVTVPFAGAVLCTDC